MRRAAIALVLCAACEKPADRCESALARLDRLDSTGLRAGRAKADAQCRSARWIDDPILRCAAEAPSDDAAAACIDDVTRNVVRDPDSRGGVGVNPLLR